VLDSLETAEIGITNGERTKKENKNNTWVDAEDDWLAGWLAGRPAGWRDTYVSTASHVSSTLASSPLHHNGGQRG